MAWETGSSSNLVSKEVAKSRIIEMAKEDGISGAFKVFYDGQLITNPDALPEQVDMLKVSVSAVLDQAV